MKILKKSKKKKNIILKIAVLSFCVYISFVLVNQQIQISNKKEELNTLNQKITSQSVKNDEMKNIVASDTNENEAYIERIARECLDFAKQGERVFVNVIGN